MNPISHDGNSSRGKINKEIFTDRMVGCGMASAGGLVQQNLAFDSAVDANTAEGRRSRRLAVPKHRSPCREAEAVDIDKVGLILFALRPAAASKLAATSATRARSRWAKAFPSMMSAVTSVSQVIGKARQQHA